MIATDLLAVELLVASGVPRDAAVTTIELIAEGRDAAVKECERLLAKMQAYS